MFVRPEADRVVDMVQARLAALLRLPLELIDASMGTQLQVTAQRRVPTAGEFQPRRYALSGSVRPPRPGR